MKKILALLAFLISHFSFLIAPALAQTGLFFPPEEGVTYKQYSMGAYVQPNGEELNWDGGYLITVAYSQTSNDVWFSNLFPQFFVDGTALKDGYTKEMMTWIHGTLSADGTHITVPVAKVYDQFYNQDTQKSFDLYVQAVKVEGTAEVVKNSFDFIVKDNGDIQIDDDTDDPTLYVCLLQHDANGDPIVGSNGVSVEDYALGYEFTLLTDDQQQYPTLPDGIEMKPYKYNMTNWDGTQGQKEVFIGQHGNDIYVKGMTTIASQLTGEIVYPNVLFKGTLAEDGKSFTLPSNQFYGIENYFGVYYITFLTAWEYWSSDEMYHPLASVKFDKTETGWELSEDYNIGCSCLDGLLYELIARATLTPDPDYVGIEQVQGSKVQKFQGSGSTIYNISGQRVSTLQKGLNIVGGKIVIK